ncbi:MAG: ATP-grasp domain-containing protein [Nitrososphaerales archaeon]
MRITVFEYISGGGFLNKPIDTSILSEGYSMLASILRDFKDIGCETITILDYRIAQLKPSIKADKIITISFEDNLEDILLNSFEYSDASLIIAPESEGILFNFVKLMESSNTTSLNSSSKTIHLCSNKAIFYEVLNKNNIEIPITKKCKFSNGLSFAYNVVKDFGLPVVFKPINGVGCSGLTIVNEYNQIESAFEKVKSASNSSDYLIQKFIHGIPVSVSLICNNKGCKALTLNLQKIDCNNYGNLRYIGGTIPFIHEYSDSALKISERVAKLFPNLKGYVGIDLILSPNGPVVMELNPRLTVSYVGLRFVGSENPASLILKSIMRDELPKGFKTHGYTTFSKIFLKGLNKEKILKTYSIDGVLTPPFDINEEGFGYGFIIGWGERINDAEYSLNRVREELIKVVM